MRLHARTFSPWIVVGALVLGCYQQPALSPQRPLHCTPSPKSDECPKGYACQVGLCAPTSCAHNSDCPAGLRCTNQGCVPPPDGGDFDADIQLPASNDGGISEVGAGDTAPVIDVSAADAPVIDGGQD